MKTHTTVTCALILFTTPWTAAFAEQTKEQSSAVTVSCVKQTGTTTTVRSSMCVPRDKVQIIIERRGGSSVCHIDGPCKN